ncbi:MAG: biotin/lipoate A/B protein ligase family protein [Verrucomicrobiota bacterium]|nr:lipoate--protein ligase family protein [Limisphaera sp.]MDW8382075.1 biotin/lipoate A/B protein ligase family protein [Verrucomicrobiota bacterium]
MKHLDWNLDTPEGNLAADEVLLDWCERRAEQGEALELLRFWMSDRPFIVVGYGQRVEHEVHLDACKQLGVPVLRRCTGGGAVLQGPGCLNYALILRLDAHGPTRSVRTTNSFVLERHRQALSKLLHSICEPISLRGETDLALGNRKFSGNAQRRRRRYLLFHGTFLLQLPLELMTAVLPIPSRQPDYRQGRSHAEFLTALPLRSDQVRQALIEAWNAFEAAPPPPISWVEQLIQSKYGRPEWILHPPGGGDPTMCDRGPFQLSTQGSSGLTSPFSGPR